MIKYVDVKTGEVLGEYPPSKDKPIYVVIEREAYEYLEQVKREQEEQSDGRNESADRQRCSTRYWHTF